MTVKEEAKLVLKDVGKGLTKILFPISKKDRPDEFLQLHYCDKCKKYHKAE
jgi:hypothetical protein